MEIEIIGTVREFSEVRWGFELDTGEVLNTDIPLAIDQILENKKFPITKNGDRIKITIKTQRRHI